jgi:hypothetical protein
MLHRPTVAWHIPIKRKRQIEKTGLIAVTADAFQEAPDRNPRPGETTGIKPRIGGPQAHNFLSRTNFRGHEGGISIARESKS